MPVAPAPDGLPDLPAADPVLAVTATGTDDGSGSAGAGVGLTLGAVGTTSVTTSDGLFTITFGTREATLQDGTTVNIVVL